MKTDATCATTANGAMSASVIGGTPPYQYSRTATGPFQSSPTFTGLVAGSYRIYYKDANGCSGVTAVIVIGPAALLASLLRFSSFSSISCIAAP